MPEALDIEDLWAQAAPPQTPRAAFAKCAGLEPFIAGLDRTQAAGMLAGLMTHAPLHANFNRLNMALRMVLSTAAGETQLTRIGLDELCNVLLADAGCLDLEDPAENLFADTVVSPFGEFRAFTGVNNAGLFDADCVIEAFTRLPADPQRDQALQVARAALTLSEALVARSGATAGELGGDRPFEAIAFPEEPELEAMARRVRFRQDELAELGVSPSDLVPLQVPDAALPDIAEQSLGDCHIDVWPLLAQADGVLVAAPAALALAASAHLINAAVICGMGATLRNRLHDVHIERMEESGWIRFAAGGRRFGDWLVREFGYEISAGRYVHVIYTLTGFAGWPNQRFGEPAPWDADFAVHVLEAVSSARAQLVSQARFREGLTLLIVGGWGNPQPSPAPQGVPDDWRIVTLTPHDAVCLGVCKDGAISDLWRLYKQADRLAASGVHVFGPNEPLNLFQLWRETDHALIPPGSRDLQAPYAVQYSTGLLRAARHEAWAALGRRNLPLPDGQRLTVSRLERYAFGGLEPIYGSMTAVRSGRALAVAAHGDQVWWLELAEGERERWSDDHETWTTALHWAARIMPLFAAELGASTAPVHLTLEVAWPSERAPVRLEDAAVQASVTFDVDTAARTGRVRLDGAWQQALYRPDNLAETTLAAALMAAVCAIEGRPQPHETLVDIATRAMGSADGRWRHLILAETAVEQLGGLGMLPSYHPLPQSAGALAKCGMAWRSGPLDTDEIRGKAACLEYATRHSRALLDDLIAQVRTFNRPQLVGSALGSLQAAAADVRSWERSARAQSALYGPETAGEISFLRETRANAVIRAGTILAEIAAVEAPLDGRAVGRIDLEDLQASAMLYWLSRDTLAALHGDCIEPHIRISATGDVLTDHRFEDRALKQIAQLRHAHDRDAASREYLERFDARKDPDADIADVLDEARAAIGDEFHDAAVYFDLALGALELAQALDQPGVYMLPRSSFIEGLRNLPNWDRDPAATVARLTLPRRAAWSELPPGTSAGDFDHAKFDRPFSLIGRPLLALTDGDDPILAIAPAVIERAARHNLAGAVSGNLQGAFWTSPAMRIFASRRGAATGIDFNDMVARRLQALGLTAWSSAQPSWCLNHKATDAVKQLGDVDVLAISRDRRTVWVIEVKDLKLCRTLGEAAGRLSDYRGRTLANGKPDKMLRHLRRVAYLRAHAPDLCGRLDLAEPPRVRGLVIVQAPQPMQFHDVDCGADGRVVMLHDAADVAWDEDADTTLQDGADD